MHISGDEPVRLELPNQWLWDIIDEFIYQFQSFSQFRSRLAKMPEPDVQALKSNPKVKILLRPNVFYSEK